MIEIFKQAGAAIIGSLLMIQSALVGIPLHFNKAAVIETSLASNWYVSPSGTAQGDGSISRPWDLQTALNQPSQVRPGDVIWLFGGVYRGTFIPRLVGSTGKPITVRSYRGERVTLDGNGSSKPVLYLGPDRDVVPKHVWFWDLEITNSNTVRTAPTATTFCPPTHCHGVYVRNGEDLKFINLVIHDNGLGIGSESAVKDFEYYGNLVYYNGWEGPAGDRAHGHGWYGKNKSTSVGEIVDNIIFMNFDNGIQARTGDIKAPVDNFRIEGNTIFENAQFSTKNRDKNFIIGGAMDARNAKILNNYTYYPPVVERGENVLGYTSNSALVDSVVSGNYFAGGIFALHKKPVNTQIYNNTIYGNELVSPGLNFQSEYSNNTVIDFNRNKPLSGNQVFVRPNKYEKGRANIAIYNWDLKPAVEVDLSSVLEIGDDYIIKDTLNFYGSPVASGTYKGGKVSVPMQGLTLGLPIGSTYRKAVHTAPQFGAFVIMSADRSSLTAPTNSVDVPAPQNPVPTLPPVIQPTPVDVPPVSLSYQYFEAENGDITKLTIVSDQSASGAKYIKTTTRDTGTAVYRFNANDNGKYAVWFRYYAPDGDQDSVFVKMDNGVEEIYDVSLNEKFGQWQWSKVMSRSNVSPMTLIPRYFQLSAGPHIMAVRGRETGTLVDRILLTNDLSFVPADAGAPVPPAPAPTSTDTESTTPTPRPQPESEPVSPPPSQSSCPSASSNLFTGCYYKGIDFDSFESSQIDPTINFSWAVRKGPLGNSVDKYSVRWEGDFNFEPGEYTFVVRTDDGSRLYIDGQLVIDKWFRQSTRTYTYVANLTSGIHRIKHEYYNNDGGGVVSLVWKKN